MNGIDKITARIEADAKRDAELTAAEANKSIEQIRKEYDRKSQEAYQSIISSGTTECENRVQRLGSTAQMEAKKSILALKQTMVSEAFVRAEQLLCGLPEKEYVAMLAVFAAKAAKTGMEELIFNDRDKAGVGAKVAKAANELLAAGSIPGKLTVSEDSRKIKGGVVVRQGDIETNCSIEAMTELYRNELATQVADAMFDR